MPVDAARILSVLLGAAGFIAAILGGVAWQVSPIYPVLFDIQRRIGHVEAVVEDLDRRLPGTGRPAEWRTAMAGQIWRIEKTDGGPDAWRFASDERYPSRTAAAQAMYDQFALSRTDPHGWRVVQVPE